MRRPGIVYHVNCDTDHYKPATHRKQVPTESYVKQEDLVISQLLLHLAGKNPLRGWLFLPHFSASADINKPLYLEPMTLSLQITWPLPPFLHTIYNQELVDLGTRIVVGLLVLYFQLVL